jgi:hypothetical protein
MRNFVYGSLIVEPSSVAEGCRSASRRLGSCRLTVVLFSTIGGSDSPQTGLRSTPSWSCLKPCKKLWRDMFSQQKVSFCSWQNQDFDRVRLVRYQHSRQALKSDGQVVWNGDVEVFIYAAACHDNFLLPPSSMA